MLNFGVITQAVVLVLSLVFCKEIVLRFPSDLAEYRTADTATRIPIAIWWGVGAFLLLLAGSMIWTVVGRLL